MTPSTDTAISVLDRLGAALCELVPLQLHQGIIEREGSYVVIPSVDYPGLTNAMFHLIRQNAGSSVAVLIRMLDVFRAVASVERDPSRLQSLTRHADLVIDDADRPIRTAADLADLRDSHRHFRVMMERGPVATVLIER